MKKKTLLFCALSATCAVYAQEVISNQGESLSIPQQLFYDYTIGEAVIETVSNSGTLTQGFHQTNWSIVSIQNLSEASSAKVYPNPFNDELHLEFTKASNANYQLIDAEGKTVLRNAVNAQKETIATQNLTMGSYTLIVTQQDQKTNIIKLIKNH